MHLNSKFKIENDKPQDLWRNNQANEPVPKPIQRSYAFYEVSKSHTLQPQVNKTKTFLTYENSKDL